jgi:hypothetical protein
MLKEKLGGGLEGEFLDIIQRRKPYPKAKTWVYPVIDKSGRLLGEIKWIIPNKRYAFVIEKATLDANGLLELVPFLQEETKKQKKNWKTQSIVDWNKVQKYDSKSN